MSCKTKQYIKNPYCLVVMVETVNRAKNGA
jgi:hypothetical protein